MIIKSPNTPRRIAVVVPKYGLAGGAEQFAAALTERLARSSPYEFHVFAHRWSSQQDSPVQFHRLPEWRGPRFLRPWAFAKAVERALRRDHFDLVHSHDRIFRADVFSLHCTPHRFWVRDIRAKTPSLFDRVMMAVERRMILENPSSTFLPVSSLSTDLFHREYPDAKGQWTTMPPGVDCLRFSKPDRKECRREVRTRHGIAADAFVVLFVGMNFKLKGLDTIMAAVAKAREQRPRANFHLLVVGKGDVSKYGAEASRHGIASSVTFTGEVTSGLEQYYRAANCLMLLSAFDTFGMVVLEAMAAGVPVIISPTVGAKDIVRNGISGCILPNGADSESAAEALGQLSEPEKWTSHTCAALQAAARLDWSAQAEKTLWQFNTTLSQRNGSA